MTTRAANDHADNPLAAVNITCESAPLHWAAFNGHLDLARFLAERDYDVNERDYGQGTTPLFWAAAKGHLSVARLLIDKGARVHVASRQGITPLHAAAEGGHADMARLLLRHGASIHARDADGETPLDWARSFGYAEVIELLKEVACRESGASKRNELRRAS